MPPVPRPILALVACISLLLTVAAPVAAHAELVTTTPIDGAQLDAVPAEAVLSFSAELDPVSSGFVVTGPDGEPAGSGTVDLQVPDRNVMRGSMTGSGDGTYSIAWTAVAADGHEGTGTLKFTVGGEALADTALPPTPGPAALIGWLLLGAAGATLFGRRLLQR